MSKKKLLVLGTMFFFKVVVAMEVTIPDWQTEANKIQEAIPQWAGVLRQDTEMYQNFSKNIILLLKSFDERKALREEIRQCLIQKDADLDKELENCTTALEQIEIDLAKDILKLESELEALKKKSDKDIKDLIALKTSTNNELSELTNTYNSIVGGAQQEAEELISSMQELATVYQESVGAREEFVKDLTKLIKEAGTDVDKEAVDMQTIENEICLK